MLTIADIANRLKLNYDYVRDKVVKRKGFPRPAVEFSQKTRFWDEGDIDLWLRSERKKLSK